MTNKQKFDERQLQELLTMGMEGKLWAVSVMYKVDAETRLYERKNLTGEQLMKLRNRMFQFGFEIMIEAGHWQIICPMDILEVHMYKQTRYLPEGSAKLWQPNTDQPTG